MKIITSDAVYVQKNDVAFLTHTDLPILTSIFMKVFGGGITIIDDSNRYEFVKFEDECEIQFFKGLDWIVDYDSVKDLGESQIIELAEGIACQQNDIASIFNNMTIDEKRKNQHMFYECEKLDFKIYSLRDFLWFKQGHIKYSLPKEIEYPDDYKKGRGLRRILSKFKKQFK